MARGKGKRRKDRKDRRKAAPASLGALAVGATHATRGHARVAASLQQTRAEKSSSTASVLEQLTRYSLAWIIGAIGSVLFVWGNFPLPWFLGALTFCLVASVAALPIERPKPLAIPMRIVLGVAIGSAFTPVLLGRMGQMTWSLLLLIPFMLFVIGMGMLFYERFAKLDRATAFFAAVPGGLTDMTTMAEDAGAKPRSVILI